MNDLLSNVAVVSSQHAGRLRRVPLVPVAGLLIAGILGAWYLPMRWGLWLTVAAVAWLIAAASFRQRELRWVVLGALGVVIACMGALRLQLTYDTIEPDHIVQCVGQYKQLATLRGRVGSYPQTMQSNVKVGYPGPPQLKFLLDCESIRTPNGWQPVRGLVRVSISEPFKHIRCGDHVEILGWVGRYRPADNPGQFDSLAVARRTGTWVWMTAPCSDAVTKLQSPDSPQQAGFSERMVQFRGAMRQHLMETGDLQNGRMLGALLLGERHRSLGELNRTMQRAGIAHFLSISGLHLGIFLGFVYYLCRMLMLSPRRAAVAVLLVLAAYLFLAEPRAPLLRSAIMAGAIAMGVLAGRRVATINALALAAIVLLLIDPRQLFAPGFQMSFLIVAGLILLHRRVHRLLFGWRLKHRGLAVYRDEGRLRRWWRRNLADGVTTAISMSVAAYLFTAPLGAVHFGIFSPYAIVLSILLLPLIVAILIPGYVAMATATIAPNLAALIGQGASSMAGLLAKCVVALDALPGLSITIYPVGAGWAVLCYVTLIVVLVVGAATLRRAAVTTLTVLLFAGVTIATQSPVTPPQPQLHLLAVGSGQCAVLQTTDGKTILLDAGTRSGFDVNERILQPFLQTRRLPAPQIAFVSHANSDHYNGLLTYMKTDHLDTLYLNRQFQKPKDRYAAAGRFLQAVEQHGTAIRRLVAGDTMQLGPKTKLEVLWPRRDATGLSSNDSSLVLRITANGQSILLPGDIAQQAQTELLRRPERLQADVLILPHHGSWTKNLPAFVQAMSPKLVLVSASRSPSPSATAGEAARQFYHDLPQRYRYLTTARNGWVQVTLAADDIDAKPMRSH